MKLSMKNRSNESKVSNTFNGNRLFNLRIENSNANCLKELVLIFKFNKIRLK